MKLEAHHKFWKKYINSDTLEREKQLKVIIENFEQLRKLLNELEKKGKRYDKNRKTLIKMFLKNLQQKLPANLLQQLHQESIYETNEEILKLPYPTTTI